jgi:hypothetical protein
MTESMAKQLPDICESWSRMVAEMLDYQWGLFKSQWQLYLDIAGKAMRPAAGSEAAPAAPAGPVDAIKQLEAEAVARIQKGLAPPQKIYEVPYRNKINWAIFPDWARPCDPELFEECTHEG